MDHEFYQAFLPVIMMAQDLDLHRDIKFYELKLHGHPCLFVDMCGSVAGARGDAGNGWPYMKAVFKKHCPRSRIGSDPK